VLITEHYNLVKIGNDKIMKTRTTFILLIVLSVNIQGQYKKNPEFQYRRKPEYHSIGILKVVNNELYPILDSIIKTKSKVSYFNRGSLFTMWFGLDSIKPDLINIYAEGYSMFGRDHDLGLFEYQNQTFFVRGFSLDTTIFSKTKQKRQIDFSGRLTNDIYLKDGTPVFDLMEIHELWCTWMCRYKKKQFRLLSFCSSDESLPCIDHVEEEYRDNSHR